MTKRGRKPKVENQETDTELERPDCPKCGGWMKSSGIDWRCTTCGGTLQKVMKDTSIQDYNDALGFDAETAEKHAEKCAKSKKRLLVTSAQNNSQASIKCLKTLKQIAKHYNCEIAVIPSHYINKSLWNKEDTKEYDALIRPYLVKGEFTFGNIIIHSDVRINPTAVNPVSGVAGHGGRLWGLYGHPQLVREPCPTPGDTFPKLLLTTGSITEPSYTVSKAGNNGAWNHCMSALILEKHNDEFTFVRQLSFLENGHCYDLDKKFTTRGFTDGHRIEVLTPGDEHVRSNVCEKEIYGKKGIAALLKPRYIARHDILDSYAVSHHHEKDPMVQFMKHHSGQNDMRAEMEQAIEFVNRTTPADAETLIVPSNHHDHLKQWLSRCDANKDHVNAMLILELQAQMREAALKGEDCDPFTLYFKPRLTCKHRFLSRNEPFYIGPEGSEVDYSQHGDVGPNGSRGSPVSFSRLPTRVVGGHTHTGRIKMGYYSPGDSAGRQEYERGYSSHSRTLVCQYWGGKRTLIDIYDGQFRAKL